MDSLVSTQWLADHFGDTRLTIVDSSWHMPASGRDGRAEFRAAHIPGARFLDIDAVADRSHPAPHMLPSASEFADAMERLGIASDDRVIVYDSSPHHTAARGWFMFRHFGVREVAILDGGLPAWLAEGRATESGEPAPRRATFTASAGDDVVTKAALVAGVPTPVLDARGAGRFEGSEADPRPGVAPGHIPGARNLPFAELYDENGRFGDLDQLKRLFAEAGIDPAQPFIASCGSGVTANSLIFAAHLLGGDKAALYDGSWSEWGADPATPKALGPAARQG